MRRFSSLKIRTQLLMLAVLLSLPALGIIVYSGVKERNKDYRKAIVETQTLVDGLGDKLENLVRESKQFGLLLAELPEVRSGKESEVQPILATVLKNNPQYQNILITDAAGEVWASAIPLAKNRKLSAADRIYFKKAKATLRFSTGEYAVSKSIGKPTFHVANPLVYKGKFAGVVILNIDLDAMRSILGSLQLPVNANYILVDQNGIILSRGRETGANVGKPMQREDLQAMENGPDRDSYEFTLGNKDRRVVSYRKIRLEGEQTPYIYIRGGMSLVEAVGAANRRLLFNLLSLLPFVIVSFIAAIFIGKKFIAGRVEKLKEAAHKVAEGELGVRVAPFITGGEFGELALSFDYMTDRLADNLDEIRRAELHIKKLNADLERKVAERTAQLETLIKEQEAFNYTVSHDLRAPLRHINGFSAILSEELGQDIPPQCHTYLQRIQIASSRMGQLIDELLELSRINSGALKLEPIDLSELAAEIVEMLTETEPERDVKMVIAADLTAKGDKTLLRMALQNLLGNAWKFTGKKPGSRIELGTSSINGEEVFFIKDTGVGFDMEYKDNLFAVFQRLHSNDEYEGTGIGLATVERIIHRHGGRIWADGKVGEGATFYFTLPKKENRSRQARP